MGAKFCGIFVKLKIIEWLKTGNQLVFHVLFVQKCISNELNVSRNIFLNHIFEANQGKNVSQPKEEEIKKEKERGRECV